MHKNLKLYRLFHGFQIGPLFAASALLTLLVAARSDQGMPKEVHAATSRLNYSRDVRPILSSKCFQCHGSDGKALQAGLRLDIREGVTHLLQSGHRAVVPGSPQKSELVRRINQSGPLQMPPAGAPKTLTANEKQILTRWIAEGAEYTQHWAFLKPIRPALPKTKLTYWAKNGIDTFILQRLEREKLKPSPPTDRVTLLRRVSFDLTGLPPTSAAVDAFVADKSPNAYEKVVDRLLASPRYGERMAQTWLDGARYADSNGYQADYERFQWRWRDWVIDAYNRNMPFDQFTLEQLAGDLLPNATLTQKVATGFNRNHRINTEGGIIPEEWRVETVIDRVETTSAVWLGLTMGCGRCHDHKYDPLSQKEFYQFSSYFNNVTESGVGEERPVNHPPLVKVPTEEQTQQLGELDKKLPALEAWLSERLKSNASRAAQWKPVVDTKNTGQGVPKDPAIALAAIPEEKRTEAQKNELTQLWSDRNDPEYHQQATLRNTLAKERATLDSQITSVMVMEEMPKPRDCYVLVRGQYDKHGESVTASLPASFGALPKGVPNNRLGLAQWIVSPDNPLTARVAVNRLWEKFFGTGLVATTEDFGTRAEYPSHPELLDWLATEFIRLKWDLKAIQKLIIMSATYCQSSKMTPQLIQRDPDNRLLAHGPRLRLSAEAIRDQALAISGLLVEKIGGPSVRPYQPDGVWDELSVYGNLRNYKHDTGEGLYRRTLYTIWKRTSSPPMMALFDVPGREMCRVRRSRTNTPLQALALMNDVTFVEASRVFAQKMLLEGGATPEQRLTYAFRHALGRSPQPTEMHILAQGLQQRIARYQANPQAALQLVSIGDAPRDSKLDTAELAAYTMTANILLNMDETINKE